MDTPKLKQYKLKLECEEEIAIVICYCHMCDSECLPVKWSVEII